MCSVPSEDDAASLGLSRPQPDGVAVLSDAAAADLSVFFYSLVILCF